LFLTIGPGLRLFGVAGVWRAIAARAPEGLAWRLTGWCIVAAVALPFVVRDGSVRRYAAVLPDGLFLLWIVTALALTTFRSASSRLGDRRHLRCCRVHASFVDPLSDAEVADNQRPPLAALSRSEGAVAGQLASTDPEGTVFLNDSPLAPSLMTIVSGRRTVLAWGPSVLCVREATRERGTSTVLRVGQRHADLAIDVLRRYHVTHVVVHPDRDRVHPGVLAYLRPVVQFRMSSCTRFGRS
jgi:hypothetical protein